MPKVTHDLAKDLEWVRSLELKRNEEGEAVDPVVSDAAAGIIAQLRDIALEALQRALVAEQTVRRLSSQAILGSKK